jgi:uncharacterized protein YfdQ (DUF2303 family)
MIESPNLPAVIAVAREAGVASVNKPEVRTINSIECLVAPGGAITPLVLPERLLPWPKRKRAKVSLYEAASFIDYVNRHKLAGFTHIFGKASEVAAGFTAIIDYHGTSPTPAEAGPAAWGEHIAELRLEITPEWGRWVAKNAKFMSQQEFAEHIEDNLTDVVAPDPAALLEVAQGLQGMKNVQFKAGRNLQDGAIKLEYVETIELAGTTNRRDSAFQVPAKFKLQLVPFVGANGVEIEARLRFRIGNDGSLSFAYILNRPYKVIEDAFNVTCEDIEKGTGSQVLLGSGSIVQATG